MAKRARIGTRSARWFAMAVAAVAIFAVLGLVQLLTGPGGRHRIGPILELVGAALAGTSLLVEWVRNGPARDR